ncbi:hypothetical protein GQ42DRAFT_122722, partial [Ramicandelaber brevisporus]
MTISSPLSPLSPGSLSASTSASATSASLVNRPHRNSVADYSKLQHYSARLSDFGPITRISSLETDFRDGKRLLALLAALFPHDSEKPGSVPVPFPERQTTRIHRINNVSKALQFLRAKGDSLPTIGSEDVIDSNIKLILGLLWTIFLRAQQQDATVDMRQRILSWTQSRLGVYAPLVPPVTDLTHSWKSGLAFCALIHRHNASVL